MSIPRVPIYIFCILRHHVTIIHVHFQWRTHLLTQVSLKTGVIVSCGDGAPLIKADLIRAIDLTLCSLSLSQEQQGVRADLHAGHGPRGGVHR